MPHPHPNPPLEREGENEWFDTRKYGSPGDSGAERKPLVVPGGDICANFPVVRHPAGVRHENARLAGYVGAEIPRVLRLRQYGGFRSSVDLRDPFVHRLVGGLDAFETIRAHVRYAVGDPFDVLLE